ncbi:MAG: hypothetical protein R3F21_09260 [Myxococcota bacterium]
MSTIDSMGSAQDPRSADPSLVTFTHIIYALHAGSLAIGILGSASIVGAFLFGIPSIIAVVLNYVRRGDVRGTWLDSHFAWQIRTFWYGFAWAVVGVVFALTIVGLLVTFVIFFGLAIWFIYRIARGWLNLRDGREMPR